MKEQTTSDRADKRSRLSIFIGTNGTGKSTLSLRLASATKRKVLIVDFDGSEPLWQQFPFVDITDKAVMDAWTSGVRKTYFALYNELLLPKVLEYFRNGILLLDDCRNYCKPAMGEGVERLMIQRRQKMLDIFALGHAFNEIPPRFYNFCTKIYLFSSMSSPVKRREELRDLDRIFEIWKRVNGRATDTKKAWLPTGKIEDNIHYCEMILP